MPKRADAIRNRERVLVAAAAVFAQRGLEAGVPEVAAAAGVGKATVYRSFPTKDHLVAAVAAGRLEALAGRLDEAASSADPAAGLTDALRELARGQAADRVVAGALASTVPVEELARAREAVRTALQRLLDAARARGAVRDDATAEDVRVLFTGVSRVLAERGEDDPAVWERHADLIVAALRP